MNYLLFKLKCKGLHFCKGKEALFQQVFWHDPRKEEPAVCTECKLFGWLAAASFGSLNALWRSVYIPDEEPGRATVITEDNCCQTLAELNYINLEQQSLDETKPTNNRH